jgi:hypothetical protein
MSYSEVKGLPVRYRHWYLKRLVRHFEEKNKIREESKSNNQPKNNQMSSLSAYENALNNKFK